MSRHAEYDAPVAGCHCLVCGEERMYRDLAGLLEREPIVDAFKTPARNCDSIHPLTGAQCEETIGHVGMHTVQYERPWWGPEVDHA